MNYILYTHVIWVDEIADVVIFIKSLKKAKTFSKSFLNKFYILFPVTMCIHINTEEYWPEHYFNISWVVVKLKWMGYIYRKKKHLLSTSNRLTVISKKYLILNIFFVNIKFYQPFMSFLEASTDHQARKPPTHETILCPICGKIFIKRDFWKFT